MVTQSGESVYGCKAANINLEYETIEGSKIAKDTKDQYDMGRQLLYEHSTLLKTHSTRG